MTLGSRMIFVMGLTLLGGGAAFGQAIRLRATTAVELHQDVRLGDFATVTAEDPKKAEAIANTVIVSDVDRPQKIKAEAVLMALMAQRGPGVLGHDFQMSGAAVCELVMAPPAASATPVSTRVATINEPPSTVRPPQPVALGVAQARDESAPVVTAAVVLGKSLEKAGAAPMAAVAATGPMTLRKAIFAAVQQGLGLPEDAIKVSLDSISPLIDEPVAANRKWQCRALTRTYVGSVPFEAQLSEGTKVLEKLTLVAQVRQKQMVVVLTAPLVRRSLVTEDMVRLEESWPDRKLTTLFGNPKDVVGLEAQSDLAVGAQLDQRDFRPSLMAHKNDVITVIYVAGSLEVQAQGRAMDDGKLHQSIPVRNDATGKDFTAYLVARNKAVVGTLTVEQEQRIREAQ